MVPISILDLSPILQGGTAAQSLHNSLDLVQHAERWGYARYWVAEHHNMPGVASAATAVVIGFLAGGTATIRVGAGGIMLPNHSPLVVAEQFGTLETLYPGRIDLGLGRAPGTDQLTARALRRTLHGSDDTYPQDVVELLGYFGPVQPGQAVRAIPGTGLNVPIWLLGSSLFSARLAAQLGLPYAFASHFAPELLMEALRLYRAEFQPSASLAEPRAMVAANVFAADSEAEAWRLSTSIVQMFLQLRTGRPGPLLPPLNHVDAHWKAVQEAMFRGPLSVSVVGDRAQVKAGLEELVARTGADELILASTIHDHAARLRSHEIVAEVTGMAPRKP